MTRIGVILGSGLSGFTKELDKPDVIYSELGGIHKKSVIEGRIGGKTVFLFTGRNHFYETYSRDKVFRNVNIAKDLNIEFLIITNAAGGINPLYNVSDLMLIKTYINLFQRRLIKKDICAIDFGLLQWAKDIAIRNSIKAYEGCYYGSTGPTYETQSEINYLKRIRVDAVGMSTIPDIQRAQELGMKTLGISCITNKLFSGFSVKVTHDEVIDAGNKAYIRFSKYLKHLINDY
ncbi:MAG: purine-nucleoside phosphorylase [Ignavibacteria bacterium]|nr:purine-nucleoside phosphorylase [Ignavibacteria bacterium]